MFLKESFCRKLCLLFLEILTSKQMLQASLPFFFKDFKEKDVEFLTEQIHQKDANKWAIVLQRKMVFSVSTFILAISIFLGTAKFSLIFKETAYCFNSLI